MQKKWLKIFGILLFLKGAVLSFLIYRGITGFVVVENIGTNISSVLGTMLIILGLGLFMLGKD